MESLNVRKLVAIVAAAIIVASSFTMLSGTMLGYAAAATANDALAQIEAPSPDAVPAGMSTNAAKLVSGVVLQTSPSAQAAAGAASTESPTSGGGVDAWVDNVLGTSPQNEPTIALNVEHRDLECGSSCSTLDQLVAGANDYRNGDSQCGVYQGTGHGHTWTNRGTLPLDGFSTAGDPVVRSGRSSDIFYYMCLHFNRSNSANELVLWRTSDAGVTWSKFATVATGVSGTDFNDKPWIVVDTNNRSPFQDNIYVCWTYFGTGDIKFRTVTDLGEGAAALLSTTKTLTSGGNNQGCSVSVKVNGEVGVAWTHFGAPSTIQFRKSMNGGSTFLGTATVQTVNAYGSVTACDGVPRALTYPDLETTRGSPAKWIVVYSSATPYGPVTSASGIDIFYTTSSSGASGAWTAPVRVNNDAQGIASVDQFMPAAAVVDRSSAGTASASYQGTLFVHWLDNRETGDGACRDWGTHIHGPVGAPADNVPIADVFSTAVSFGGGFIGDYQDAAAGTIIGDTTTFPGTLHPIFYDSRDTGSGANQNVFTDPFLHTFIPAD